MVQQLWKALEEKGYIYKGYHEGWYSVSDECFYTEKQIETIEKNGIKSTVYYKKFTL